MVLNWIISWKIYVTPMKGDRANPFPNPLWVSMINSVIKMVARLVKRPKNLFICIFGLLSYRYNIYQVRIEFRKLFGILVHPKRQSLQCTKRLSISSLETRNLKWLQADLFTLSRTALASR